MSDKKVAKVLSEKELAKEGWYKGYDMRWLRRETDHPDYHLVAEFDKKYGPKGKKGKKE